MATFSREEIQDGLKRLGELAHMKLSAWRDDLDISDARRLLQELKGGSDYLTE